MKIIPEIEVTDREHDAITQLRNASFPDHQVERSYYKQLPHMRALQYCHGKLIGYMGLDYRVVCVGGTPLKVLGVIDICIDKSHQGQGIGSAMLTELSDYAAARDVDFIILMSELDAFYTSNGFNKVSGPSSWLRLHEHQNYGIAFDQLGDLFVKPMSGKTWAPGHLDWLGYLY
ncbi:GNAT family N-acetyltransferase [Photobacterium atrarenae]|uniref:GNAT family N-acetyltransferase n=1 Tax=Photobacterium atrarenae TaxID=865757 RepID=A0ABY5GJC1_9GAMM|nr:GNAT family N-acetyltransferase [Photobacterium atrarenae]UTV29405.1 GNAT family N-acetyltransferase [Photobacterium atrarenae]